MAEIEAKVAQIIDKRTVVLNKGESDGVGVGMRFAILNRNGAEIFDPDTGESLGAVDIEKAIVKVVRVSDRVAVARTFRKLGGSSGILGAAWAAQTSVFGTPPRLETLQTDEHTYKDELDESESYVKRGDIARQVHSSDEYYDDDK